jgi:hypothetical protein
MERSVKWSPLDDLAEGMTLEQVRQSLAGWRAQVANAMISTDHLHLFHTWDFTPPPQSDWKTVRMIFDNGKLMLWDDPAAVASSTQADHR